MIEDFLSELVIPIKAIKLLTIFLQENIYDEIICDVNKDQRDKNENTLAINYTMKLVNNDILKLRRKYYKMMVKEKYDK